MSEILGQSGHALPSLQQPVCAKLGSAQRVKSGLKTPNSATRRATNFPNSQSPSAFPNEPWEAEEGCPQLTDAGSNCAVAHPRSCISFVLDMRCVAMPDMSHYAMFGCTLSKETFLRPLKLN